MKVLLVGSGAREHATAESIINSGGKLYSFVSNKNPGILKISEEWKQGNLEDLETITQLALKNDVSLAVIGPESPLAAGIVDSLISNGIDCVGPRKDLAKLESDKAFARTLMQDYKIGGCPKFEIFTNADAAEKFLEKSEEDWVLKPAGLTGGKGVRVMGEHLNKEEAKKYAREVIEHRIGDSPMLVVEERLKGQEITLQAFSDGETVVPMPVVQDHKRAYDGDIGPNTGGMGSYSDANHLLPFLSKSDHEKCLKIMQDTVAALKKHTGFYYKGILYGQFMLTKEGIKVIEFNVRFGDPEAMNVLPLLESNALDIYKAIAHRELKSTEVKFKNKATVCKYVVPKGYPEDPKTTSITVNSSAISDLGARFYWASVSEKNKKLYSTSSRTAATLGISDTIEQAGKIAEKALSHIQGDLFHRKDIGTRELLQKRIDDSIALQ